MLYFGENVDDVADGATRRRLPITDAVAVGGVGDKVWDRGDDCRVHCVLYHWGAFSMSSFRNQTAYKNAK